MTDLADHLRDVDHEVLCCIRDGEDDVQKIKAATTLSKRQVNYAFEKLEDLGLIEVSRPEGQVERVIDGQKRVFDAPKEAELTETGVKVLRFTDDEPSRYQDLSREELVETIHDLENRIDTLEDSFEAFRKQVLRKLNE